MRTIEQILNYLFLIAVGLYAVIMLVDTISIIINPESYRTAHGFTETNLSWTSKSVVSYIVSNTALLLMFVLSFFTGFKNLRNKGSVKLWKALYYLCFVGLLVLVVGGYSYWTGTGFDH